MERTSRELQVEITIKQVEKFKIKKNNKKRHSENPAKEKKSKNGTKD